MRQHGPKLNALEALAAQQLSDQGRLRLERHLAGCNTCRDALQLVREYIALRAAARGVSVSEPSWERLEATIDAGARPSRATGRSGRLLAVALPILAVAATVVVGWIGLVGQRQAAEVAVRTSAPSRAPSRPVDTKAVRGWITVGTSGPHGTGTDVVEGTTLRTPVGQELHVHLAEGTGIVLWENSELFVARLQEHAVRLTLVRGGVSNAVGHLGPDDTYVVDAGGVTAEVRGTHFFVGRNDGDVRVDVHEGHVALVRRGEQIGLLQAGQHYTTAAAAQTEVADRTVIGLDARSRGWPTLTLPALERVAAWRVGDARWTAHSPISLRAPAGVVALRYEDSKGAMHDLQVPLTGPATTLDAALVRTPARARLPVPKGQLAPEQISPVIEAALPSLRACYEQGLGVARELGGVLALAVHVGADGRVARTRLQGDLNLPSSLRTCIATQARGWVFPAPDGGPVTFEVDLNLTPTATPTP